MKIYRATLAYERQLIVEDPHCGKLFDSPSAIYTLMRDHAELEGDPTVEYFWVAVLNRKNRVLAVVMVTKGTANASLVHPREVLKPVIIGGGSAFVCIHNHPSGDPSPSQADIRATRQLREAAKVMQLDFLDHVIVGDKDNDPVGNGFYSFAESGLL